LNALLYGNATVIQHSLCDFVSSTNIETIYSNWSCKDYIPISNYCYWTGISCEGSSLGIELHAKISGSIPKSLGSLIGLSYLDLSSNALTGTVPTSLGLLTNLYYLNLGLNKLSGAIPSSFGFLTNLQTLILTNNILTSSIPTSFTYLSGSIQHLTLFYNFLSSTIPLGVFSEITGLPLHKISKFLPSQLCSMSAIQYISLGHNLFTSTIPSCFG